MNNFHALLLTEKSVLVLSTKTKPNFFVDDETASLLITDAECRKTLLENLQQSSIIVESIGVALSDNANIFVRESAEQPTIAEVMFK